jgi:hypothetical protein
LETGTTNLANEGALSFYIENAFFSILLYNSVANTKPFEAVYSFKTTITQQVYHIYCHEIKYKTISPKE